MYQINRAVRLNVIDAERVQVRLPHNDHFTIRFNSEVIRQIVESSETLDEDGWRGRFRDLGIPEEHAGGLLSMLRGAGVIIEKPALETGALAVNEHAQTKAIKFGLEPPLIESVAVVGEGRIAEWARHAAALSPVAVAVAEDADFLLFCEDEEVFSRMRRLWERPFGARFKSMLWYDGTEVRFGPLHVVGETACFGCYLRRLDAASHHVDEAAAYERAARITSGGGGDGLTAPVKDLVGYVVKRALLCIVTAQFNQLKPSVIQSWSVLGGHTSETRVLFNPYCDICQKGATAVRAVRDMA